MTSSFGTVVDFWFDPGCPFTWRTSRWLVDVASRRAIDLRWHLMSLSVLNEGQDKPPGYWERRHDADRALRVLAASEKSGGVEAVGALYSVLGNDKHEQDQTFDDRTLLAAVQGVGLPPEVAAAADDGQWDAVIRASHDVAQRSVGTDAGSPVVALDGGRGFFGPVVVPAPMGDDADRLFDALLLLSSVSEFSEIKTSRSPM
jgi:2-hydroxychromene-2-carboxylate isomerase